ncbi:MAG TPA: hypothetical protein VJZ27_01300, partial [Aggregatilineales bacterium]|nr:hypothetical protein [Aggregatilineales bacterium]
FQNVQTEVQLPLIEIERQLRQISQANLPEELRQVIGGLHRKTGQMLLALKEITEAEQRPSKGIHRISPR